MSITTGDIFSGFGGFSEGAEAAGATTHFGANHWIPAIRTFEVNHPDALTFHQDLSEANWSEFPRVDMMIAGPSCKGFTKARGRERKHHDAFRNCMFAVNNAAEVLRPEVLVIENVPEVADWARMPAWLHDLRCLGYSTETHILDAADFGVPQHRVRWFCIAVQASKPMGLTDHLASHHRAHVNVRDFIDWTEKAAGAERGWSKLDKPGRSPKVLKQCARARAELGTDRFLFPYYGSGSGKTGRSLDRPMGTLVAHDIWAVADGDRMRMLQPQEAQRIMGFPSTFKRCASLDRRTQMRGFGNAVCPPVATAIVDSILAA